MAPALFEGSAPFAPMASLEAWSGPPQPAAAAKQLRRRRRLLKASERGFRTSRTTLNPSGTALASILLPQLALLGKYALNIRALGRQELRPRPKLSHERLQVRLPSSRRGFRRTRRTGRHWAPTRAARERASERASERAPASCARRAPLRAPLHPSPFSRGVRGLAAAVPPHARRVDRAAGHRRARHRRRRGRPPRGRRRQQQRLRRRRQRQQQRRGVRAQRRGG